VTRKEILYICAFIKTRHYVFTQRIGNSIQTGNREVAIGTPPEDGEALHEFGFLSEEI
jgi:hypothetical protein